MQTKLGTDRLRKVFFLAGPTPRNNTDYNWRPKAIVTLQELGFNGAVFIPLPRNGQWTANYEDQITWELQHLNASRVIVFWIPRDLKTLPGFTTNVEFRMYVSSGKAILGFPETAPRMKYLALLAALHNVPTFHTLEETLEASIKRC